MLARESHRSILKGVTKVAESAPTPLEEHIAVFSRADGYLSYDSMEKKLEILGDKPEDAKSLANKVSFAGGIKTHWCPYRMFTAKEGVVLVHSQSTGIINADGTNNQAKLDRFLSLAETDATGKKFITQSAFYAELAKVRKEDNNDWLGIDAAVSNGEWQSYWAKFVDHYKGDEPCTTVETFKQFFETPKAAFARVENRELPAARPGARR